MNFIEMKYELFNDKLDLNYVWDCNIYPSRKLTEKEIDTFFDTAIYSERDSDLILNEHFTLCILREHHTTWDYCDVIQVRLEHSMRAKTFGPYADDSITKKAAIKYLTIKNAIKSGGAE